MSNIVIRRPWRSPLTTLFDRDPFAPNFRRVFDMMNQPPFAQTATSEAVGIMPAVEISESNGEFLCTAELPGLMEKDVHVSFSDDALVIKGEKKEERETKDDKRFHMWERSYGTFERTFTFPAKIDADKISAEFKNGVLTIKLPKAAGEKVQGRAIPVVAK